MNTVNLNQEWDFVAAEVHSKKPNKVNLTKREILFALQILLCQISLAAEASRRNSLRKDYFVLKEMYRSEKYC